MSEPQFLAGLIYLTKTIFHLRHLIQRGSLGRKDSLFSLSPFGKKSSLVAAHWGLPHQTPQDG